MPKGTPVLFVGDFDQLDAWFAPTGGGNEYGPSLVPDVGGSPPLWVDALVDGEEALFRLDYVSTPATQRLSDALSPVLIVECDGTATRVSTPLVAARADGVAVEASGDGAVAVELRPWGLGSGESWTVPLNGERYYGRYGVALRSSLDASRRRRLKRRAHCGAARHSFARPIRPAPLPSTSCGARRKSGYRSNSMNLRPPRSVRNACEARSRDWRAQTFSSGRGIQRTSMMSSGRSDGTPSAWPPTYTRRRCTATRAGDPDSAVLDYRSKVPDKVGETLDHDAALQLDPAVDANLLGLTVCEVPAESPRS